MAKCEWRRMNVGVGARGRLYAVLVLSLCASLSANAQRPDDAKRERGRGMLAKMPSPKPGDTVSSYFEQLMGPNETIGYIVSSITAEADKPGDPGLTYKYEMNTALRFHNNARIEATIRARLRLTFEPIELEIRRVFIKPDGRQTVSVNLAQVAESRVTLTSGEGEGRRTQEVERPPSPFVFAMEILMQRLDMSSMEDFVLPEFDPQTGKAGELTYVVQPTPQGGWSAAAFLPDDQPTYQFWFKPDGKLERWGEAGVPTIIAPVTAQRVEEIKLMLKSTAEEWERQEKAMQPKSPGN